MSSDYEQVNENGVHISNEAANANITALANGG